MKRINAHNMRFLLIFYMCSYFNVVGKITWCPFCLFPKSLLDTCHCIFYYMSVEHTVLVRVTNQSAEPIILPDYCIDSHVCNCNNQLHMRFLYIWSSVPFFHIRITLRLLILQINDVINIYIFEKEESLMLLS